MAIDWPQLDELKRVLDVTSDDWDDTLQRNLDAAIEDTKTAVGLWDDGSDAPDEKLAAAALRRAELLSMRPDAADTTRDDPTWNRNLYGRRRRFGVA